jgi:uncharacterized protein YoxC
MLEISLVFISVAFFLLVLFAIPFLLQIWRAAKNITLSLEILNQRLPGILKNLEETTANVNRTSLAVSVQVEWLSVYVQKFQGILAVLSQLEAALRGRLKVPVFRSLPMLIAATKGVRTFWRVLWTPEGSPRR